MSCSSLPARRAIPTASEAVHAQCPDATFSLPTRRVPAATVAATDEAIRGTYRRLGLRGQEVVAVGTKGGRVLLVRGVPDNDFTVSMYAHGPARLVPVSLLGQQTYLYPSADLPGVNHPSMARDSVRLRP